MTRRETYPCSSLESVIQVVQAVSSDASYLLLKRRLSKDAIRLTEILGFIEKQGYLTDTKKFALTMSGQKLLQAPNQTRKTILFQSLLKEISRTLP